MKIKLLFGLFSLIFTFAKVKAQSTNSGAGINWGKTECGVQVAIVPSTNIVAIGGYFTITEHIRNSSTNSIVLNSSTPYLLMNDSGKKYQLPIILDISNDYGPNINAPFRLGCGGVNDFSYTVQVINPDIQPDDFTIQVTRQITTPDNKVCSIKSNSPKLKVIRR